MLEKLRYKNPKPMCTFLCPKAIEDKMAMEKQNNQHPAKTGALQRDRNA